MTSSDHLPQHAADRLLPLRSFTALLLRDAHVVTREKGRFLIRTISQPLMLVFVFTYVFPAIGQGFEAGAGRSFTDVLVPGVLAITVMIKGIQAVALPLVQEFGYTREVEDRVMAPLPVWAVAMAKIASGAVQALIAALIVFPIILIVPAEPVSLDIYWPGLVAMLLLAPVVSSAFGLVLGTFFEPRTVPLMFSVIILPITFLGATYYSWADLGPLRWLQIATLVNPLVYVSEGFRFALTSQLPHMDPAGILTALLLLAVTISYAGARGFRSRVLS